MAEWTDEIARIDRKLHEDGVPDACRLRTVAVLMTAFAQADKAKRDAAAHRALCKRAFVLCREMGATRAAAEMCVPVRTLYWLRDKHINCASGVTAALQETG